MKQKQKRREYRPNSAPAVLRELATIIAGLALVWSFMRGSYFTSIAMLAIIYLCQQDIEGGRINRDDNPDPDIDYYD